MSNDSGPAPDTDISGVPVPAPSATAWFHCFAGIAGDMALGSLLDAGADLDEVVDMVRRLPLGGWALEAEPVLRGGIAATRAVRPRRLSERYSSFCVKGCNGANCGPRGTGSAARRCAGA